MNTELRRRMPEKPQVHERTIGKHLDGKLYALKLSRTLPDDRNRPDVIEDATNMLTGSCKRRVFIILSLSTNVDLISGKPELKDGLALESVHLSPSVRSKGTQHYSLLGGV